MADVTFSVGAEPVQGDFDEIADAAARAISQGLKAASKSSREFADDLSKDLTSLLKRTSGRLANARALGLDTRQFEPLERGLERILALQRRLDAETRDGLIDPQGLARTRAEFNAINSLISSQSREFQSTVAARNVTARGELQAAKQAGQQRNIIARKNADLEVAQDRNAAKRKIVNRQILNSQLLQLERTLSQAVIGIARGTSNAIQAVYNSTIGSVRRNFETRRTIISGGLRNETRLFQSQARQVAAIREQSNRGLIGSFRTGALAGTIGGGIGITALGSLGFERAADIENIQKRINVLTGDVIKGRALFAQLKDFAATTSFDLTGVSDLASRLLTINNNTEQILPNIKALAGAITLVGGRTDDLEGIARALGQVESLGRLSGEEINQLSERLPGINIRQLFADALGFESTAAFVKAQEAGEISGEAAVDAFFRAVRGDPRFTQALEAGANSFSNLAANAKENFADVGAAFIQRFEGPIKAGLRTTVTAFAGLANFIRGGELTGGLELLRLVLGKVALALAGVVAAKGAVEVFQLLGRGVGLLLTPMGLLAATLTAAGAAFAFFFQRSERFRNIVKGVANTVADFGRSVGVFIVDQFEAIGERLQPAIRFFEVIGDRIVGIGRTVREAFAAGGLGGLFDALRTNLADLASDLFALSRPIRERIGDLLGSARDIALRFRDRIVAAFRSIDFGSIVGFIRTDLGQAIAGGAAGAIVGGLIGGPVGAALGVGAAALIAKFVVPSIKRALANINVPELFGNFLNGVREVGRRIALILSDRRTLLGAAGIAAAGAAIAVQFVQGFVTGLLSNLDDIVAAGKVIIDSIFSLPSIVKSIAAFAILIRGALTNQFKSAGVGKAVGALLGKDIADATVQAATRASLGSRLKGVFSALGKSAGQIFAVGLSAALSGSALGDASSGLEQGLGIAGIAGSAAAAFAAASPAGPAVAGAAAAATAGVGLVSAALSANAKRAKEAKDRMSEFLTVLRDVGSEGPKAAKGIADIIGGNVEEASDKALRGLKDLRVNMEQFQAAVAAGTAGEVIEDVKDQVEALHEQFLAIDSDQGAILSNEESKRLRDARAALGFLEDQVDAVTAAKERANLERLDIFGDVAGGSGPGRVRSAIEAARRETERLGEAARRAREQAGRLLALQQATNLNESLEGIRNRAEGIRAKAVDAKNALADLIRGPDTPDAPAATAETVRALPAISGQIEEALAAGAESALGRANLEGSLGEFKDLISQQFAEAITSDDPGAALAQSLQDSTIAINQIATTPEARQALLDELNREFAVAQTKIPVGVEANKLEATAAGIEARATALNAAVAAGEIPVAVAANIASAIESGTTLALTADNIVRNSPAEAKVIADTKIAAAVGAILAGTVDENVQAKQILISNIDADTSQAFSVGADITAGIVRGIKAGSGSVQSEANRMAQIAINAARDTLQTDSPSKVFMGIGFDIVEGLALGIEDSTEAAVSAAQAVANAVIEAGLTAANRARSAVVSARTTIFESIFLGSAQRAREAGLTAQQAITTSFEGIRLSVESEARKLFEAASRPANERTAEDLRTIAASNFASLSNISNQKAIQEAVEAVRSLGRAILEQGGDATAAAKAMQAYRDSLIRTAAAAGLNATQVLNLVELLGLSNTALDQFVKLSQKAVNVVSAAPGAVVPAAPLTTGPNPVQMFIENKFDLPFGDPEAVSLAVVNRLAQRVR